MSAALTAATQGLKTVLIEKSPYWGGSTSRSGGGVWIPNNSVLKRDGVDDTVEQARAYVHAIIGEHAPAAKIDTYIDRGPEALDYLMAHSPLELEWVKNYSETLRRASTRRRPQVAASAVHQGSAEHGGTAERLPLDEHRHAPPAGHRQDGQGRLALQLVEVP